jgi:hypothetical protein
MSKTSLLLAGVLSLSGLCMAGTKSYTIVLEKPEQVGTLKLAAGSYKLQVQGVNAVFTDSDHKTYTTPAKVETAPKKFNFTAVETKDEAGAERITTIDLGGTNTQVAF